ncbi:MAG: tetratricopeptide repeat protein [Cyclobacteriaceae bacterium]|nr:tetratricopeptide repeat protein [Cyclobacteriaceae bacterium]
MKILSNLSRQSSWQFFIVFLSFFLILFSAHSEESKLQSKQDTEAIIENYLKLAGRYNEINSDSSYFFASEALILAQKTLNRQSEAIAHQQIARYFQNALITDSAVTHYINAADIYRSVGDSSKVANLNYKIGALYFNSANYREALKFSMLALEMSESFKLGELAAQSHSLLCDIYSFIGKKELAVMHCLKSLGILDDHQSQKGKSNIYNTLGIINLQLAQYDKSKSYFLDALNIARTLQDRYAEATTISNLGDLYLETKDYDMALHYFRQALEIDQLEYDTMALGYSYYSIGNTYSQKGDKEEALKYLYKSVEYSKRSLDLEMQATVFTEIGKIYTDLGNFTHALEYLNKGLETGIIINTDPILKSSYKGLAEYYEKTGNYRLAISHFKNYLTHAENLYRSETQLRISETEAIFDLEKKDKEIEILLRDADIRKLQARQRNIIIGGLLLFGLLFSTIAFVLFMRNQEKNKANQELEYKNFAIERQKCEIEKQKDELLTYSEQLSEKNYQINESLTYARRLQMSMLPARENLEGIFDESFVLYMPKDVIGGDFYWLMDLDNLAILAVGDCAGHGVPGAFMTILAHNILNKIVIDQKIMQPSLIMDELHNQIVKNLHQYKSDNFKTEGIDLAICIIDKKEHNIGYAGCQIPLYLMRDNKFFQYEPEKYAPGNHHYKTGTVKTQVIKAKKGDVIYLTSDGYQDQFGGPLNKKFMKSRFKDLLTDIAQKPLKVQEEILVETYLVWKEDLVQTDDVLIIGCRL